ncbi:MAG: MarR family winged helix-turn-helix transcriptional regulator [Butyricicoccaceae bacterium]
MDYRALALELVKMRGDMQHLQVNRQISDMVKGELFVLAYLYEHSRTAYPKDLSRGMRVSTARIATLLNRLEEKQLIARMTDPEDNRQIIVTLTDKGTEAIQKKWDELLDRVGSMLEQLGEEDAKEYIRIQKKIIHNFLTK